MSRSSGSPPPADGDDPAQVPETDWHSLLRKAVFLTTPRRSFPSRSKLGRERARLLDPVTGLLPPRTEEVVEDKSCERSLGESVSAPSLDTKSRRRPTSLRKLKRKPKTSYAFDFDLEPPYDASQVLTPEPIQGCGKPGCEGAEGSDDSGDDRAKRAEIERLRRRLQLQTEELQETCWQLDQTQSALRSVQAEHEELTVQHNTLQRVERTTTTELMDERHKNEELGKQVKAMRQNLASITGAVDGNSAGQQATSLQKRCFKLEQQNTVLRVHSRLLSRQKSWAEAKARVLQNEVSSIYLGTHDRVKDNAEIETATQRVFVAGPSQRDEAHMHKLSVPAKYKHEEAVADFITHITHTQGKDPHGFLQSSRVFTEAIRNDCLAGLGREFCALWQISRRWPSVLRVAEQIVHLRDHKTVFERLRTELASLLGCSRARLWVVDHSSIWTYVEEEGGGKAQTCTLSIPRSAAPADLAGHGYAAAAYATRSVVNVVGSDPRLSEIGDRGANRPAQTALCVPLGKNKSQVRMVLEAVDKLPQFDAETDGVVMKMIGRVAMQAIGICEARGTTLANQRRKDTLMKLFTEFVPIEGPVELLRFHEQSLKRLFRSGTTALSLIEPRGSVHLRLNPDTLVISRVQHHGLRGLVGHVARKLNQVSFSAAQLHSSPYFALVDLAVPRGNYIHTVPICEGQGCVAVSQFVCPKRFHSTISDDGTFHEENHLHFRLLTMLLALVRKHLDVFEQEEE